jgi:transposase-like protein
MEDTLQMREYNEKLFFDNEDIEETGVERFTLEAVVRSAAQTMIQGALEAEVTEFLQRLPFQKSSESEGFRGYRNGYHPGRTITTAVGPLEVKQPRVSDISPEAGKYRSELVRPYKRRSEALDVLFPKLFIEGLSTRDFEPALRALIGEEAPLSPSSISRLNRQFKEEFGKWKGRRLDDLEIVYIWVDGVYLKAGISDEKLCALVIIGADRTGKKQLLAIEEGYRESKESWLSLLRDLKVRGMNEPAIAIADGALGFWAALPEIWHQTKEQLCWLHKIRNILDKLPKKEHREATERLRAIYLAEDKESAKMLAEKLLNDWKQVGYLKSAECLEKALERLLTFHLFPSQHARHLRTTNPIESPFAAVKLRTNAVRRFRTPHSALHLLFKLLERSEKGWQRLSYPEKLKEVKLPGKQSDVAFMPS